MITHSVFMKLKYGSGSVEEKSFLDEAAKLENIAKVLNYKIVKETSPKNDYTFGLVMNFETQEDYDFYNNHSNHTAFVENVWIPNVESFQEIDYITL